MIGDILFIIMPILRSNNLPVKHETGQLHKLYPFQKVWQNVKLIRTQISQITLIFTTTINLYNQCNLCLKISSNMSNYHLI